jgi:hypothetical protein
MASNPRLAALREVFAEEPEILQDVEAAFNDPRRMPHDIDRGLAGPAWETFVARGLVPTAGPPRRFVQRHKRRCPDCRGRGGPSSRERCGTCLDAGHEFVDALLGHPPTLRAALALTGSDLAAAEALARDAAVRLWPWRGARGQPPVAADPPNAITWRIDQGGGPLELVRVHRAVCPLLFEVLARLARDAGRRPLMVEFESLSQPLYPWANESWWYRREPAWPPSPEADRSAREFYDELAAAGAAVPAGGVRGTFPSFVPGGRLADLPNPFVPLCELAARGVTLERLDADAITLARAA